MKQLLVLVLLTLLYMPYAHAEGSAGKQRIDTKAQRDTQALTFTSDINLYGGNSKSNQTWYGNETLTYSTHDWDIGISSQNIDFGSRGNSVDNGDGTNTPVGSAQNFQADTYLQIAKTVYWSKKINTSFGVQAGWALDTWNPLATGYNTPGRVHLFDYIDNEFKLFPWLKVHGGAFWVNYALATTNSYTGGMTGFEVFYKDFSFQGDYFGGHSNISGGQAEVNYYGIKNLKLYAGIGVPETNSGNEFYGVAGFQVSTAAFAH